VTSLRHWVIRRRLIRYGVTLGIADSVDIGDSAGEPVGSGLAIESVGWAVVIGPPDAFGVGEPPPPPGAHAANPPMANTARSVKRNFRKTVTSEKSRLKHAQEAGVRQTPRPVAAGNCAPWFGPHARPTPVAATGLPRLGLSRDRYMGATQPDGWADGRATTGHGVDICLK
jgi:hypothetical protein